jgi:dTMP kinase
MFITFEGIDGSGKTTAATEVCRKLGAIGHSVKLTCEPTKTWLGDAVKRSHKEKISPFTEAFLFMADRATHTDQIKRWLAEYDIVISDRYCDSTFAYQGAALLLLFKKKYASVDWLMQISERFIQIPRLTFLFVIDPQIGLERINYRNELSKFEREEFLARVQENYIYIAKKQPTRFIKLDGCMAREKIVEKILTEITKNQASRLHRSRRTAGCL